MILFMATKNISWQAWAEMGSPALFGTYSKRCDITHQELRSPVSDEDWDSLPRESKSWSNVKL